MFLHLNHKKLEVYKVSRELVKECYLFTKRLPADEKFALVSQIKRAALSVKLNIAEGASQNLKQKEKDFMK
jgi:four helix bundle protein